MDNEIIRAYNSDNIEVKNKVLLKLLLGGAGEGSTSQQYVNIGGAEFAGVAASDSASDTAVVQELAGVAGMAGGLTGSRSQTSKPECNVVSSPQPVIQSKCGQKRNISCDAEETILEARKPQRGEGSTGQQYVNIGGAEFAGVAASDSASDTAVVQELAGVAGMAGGLTGSRSQTSKPECNVVSSPQPVIQSKRGQKRTISCEADETIFTYLKNNNFQEISFEQSMELIECEQHSHQKCFKKILNTENKLEQVKICQNQPGSFLELGDARFIHIPCQQQHYTSKIQKFLKMNKEEIETGIRTMLQNHKINSSFNTYQYRKLLTTSFTDIFGVNTREDMRNGAICKSCRELVANDKIKYHQCECSFKHLSGITCLMPNTANHQKIHETLIVSENIPCTSNDQCNLKICNIIQKYCNNEPIIFQYSDNSIQKCIIQCLINNVKNRFDLIIAFKCLCDIESACKCRRKAYKNIISHFGCLGKSNNNEVEKLAMSYILNSKTICVYQMSDFAHHLKVAKLKNCKQVFVMKNEISYDFWLNHHKNSSDIFSNYKNFSDVPIVKFR